MDQDITLIKAPLLPGCWSLLFIASQGISILLFSTVITISSLLNLQIHWMDYISRIKLVTSWCYTKRHLNLISKPSACLGIGGIISGRRRTIWRQCTPPGSCGFSGHTNWSLQSRPHSFLAHLFYHLWPSGLETALPLISILAFWPGHISLGSRWGFAWRPSDDSEESKWTHAAPSPGSSRNNIQCFETRNLESQDLN